MEAVYTWRVWQAVVAALTLIVILVLVFAHRAVQRLEQLEVDGKANRPFTDKEASAGAVLKGIGSELGAYEVNTLVPSDGHVYRLIIYVPGNPGLPGWYAAYAAALAERTKAKVVVLGLVGHLSWPNARRLRGGRDERRTFNIFDQVAHVAERARCLIVEHAAMPVTLIGHSIGAWVAVQATLALHGAEKECACPSVLLLTPFLEVPMSLRALPFSFRFEYHVLCHVIGPVLREGVASLATWLRCSPATVRRLLPHDVAHKFTPECRSLVEGGCLHRDLALNVLWLVQTELEALGRPFGFGAPSVHAPAGAQPKTTSLQELARAGQARALFVPGDKWAPLLMAEACYAAGVPADILESTATVEMKHAFSVTPASCARVVDWTVRALAEMPTPRRAEAVPLRPLSSSIPAGAVHRRAARSPRPSRSARRVN